MDKGAFAIHGIGDDFLSDKPLFANTIIDFLKFIGNSPLIIHNAAFDMQFINAELGYAGYPLISHTKVIDTLQMARKKFPGSPASLDALCKRFSISLSGRDKHGALIDAELLALVYIQLTGGTQGQIAFMEGEKEKIVNALIIERKIRHFNITELEKLQHQEMIQKLKNPIWLEE